MTTILSSSKAKLAKVWAATIILICIAFLVGISVAIFPIGITARVMVLVLGFGALLLAWAFRGNGYGNVSVWNFTQLAILGVVGLSVLWPRYLFMHAAGLPGINPLTLGCMLLLAICVFQLVGSVSIWLHFKRQFANGGVVALTIAIWMLWRFFASAIGEQPLSSVVELLKEMIYIGSFVIFGLFIAAADAGSIRLIRVFLACGIVVAVIGIFEAFAHRNPFVQFISQAPDPSASRALLAIAVEKMREGNFRAQSTFDHPIVFAQFIAALVPLAIFAVIYEKKLFWRFIGLLAIPVALIGIIKTGSRSGLVSVGVAFFLVGSVWWLRAIMHGRISKVLAIIALPALIFAVILSALVLNELIDGRNNNESGSSSVRFLMLRYGINALWDSPIWGFGHGMALDKAGVVNPFGLATIDNYLLTIAVDYGYFGLLVFLVFIVSFSWKSIVFAVKNDTREGAFVGACLASVLALFVTFLGLSIYQNMTMLWLLVCAVFPIWDGRKIESATLVNI